MSRIDQDPVIGSLFDTPEKKARWMVRLKLAYFLWLAFVIIGITALILYYFWK